MGETARWPARRIGAVWLISGSGWKSPGAPRASFDLIGSDRNSLRILRFPRFLDQRSVPIAWKSLRSEEHTSELQSLMRISYAVFCLKKKNKNTNDKK